MGARGSGMLAAVAAVAVVAGCGTPGGVPPDSVACPAIAWSNNLTVDLAGDTAGVDALQVCFDGRCSSSRGLPPKPAPKQDVVTINPDELPAPPPGTSTDSYPLFFSSRLDDDTWAVSFDMSAPDEITVSALDAQGQVLATDSYTLTWIRVGGSEQCGGPMEAGPLTLNL